MTILVIVILFGVVYKQPIKNQLNSWSLLPEPEKLTELYFNNSTSLPISYNPGVSQHVSFEIHNIEYQSWGYHYTISAISNNSPGINLGSGSFTLAQNQYKDVSVDVLIPNLGPHVQVDFKLANPSESIDYWVDRG